MHPILWNAGGGGRPHGEPPGHGRAVSADELHVVATKYQFTPSTTQVTAGEPVRFVLSSMDTVHGFSIPKLKIDRQIPKGGDPVIVEFACSEFCGIGHGQMKATLISTPTTQLSR